MWLAPGAGVAEPHVLGDRSPLRSAACICRSHGCDQAGHGRTGQGTRIPEHAAQWHRARWHDSLANGRHRERSEEHTSELQSLMRISYAVFCLKKKKKKSITIYHETSILNNNK